MNPSLGLQLYSVREHLQQDYPATIERVAQIGYKTLELINMPTDKGLVFGKDLNAAQLKKLLDQYGLQAVSSHVVPFIPGFNWERSVADFQELGVTHLACAIAFFNDRKSLLEFCKTFNRDAEYLKKNGIQYYYHNHFNEFQLFEGQTAYDIMLDNMDKDLVKFEFDSYWAVRGGQDPVAWLKKIGTRCDLLHQKDLPASVSPVNLFDKLGHDGRIDMQAFAGSLSGGGIQFTEVGQGVLDIPSIIAAGREYGNARYIFVEQDLSERGELESIEISYKNLSAMLA